MNALFRRVGAWADSQGFGDYAFEFLHALETWDPERGSFVGRARTFIREAAMTERRKQARAGSSEAIEFRASPEDMYTDAVCRTAREEVLQKIDEAVSSLSDAARVLWAWCVCRTNQHTSNKKGYIRVAWAIDAVLSRKSKLSRKHNLPLNEETVREAWREIHAKMKPIAPHIEGMLW